MREPCFISERCGISEIFSRILFSNQYLFALNQVFIKEVKSPFLKQSFEAYSDILTLHYLRLKVSLEKLDLCNQPPGLQPKSLLIEDITRSLERVHQGNDFIILVESVYWLKFDLKNYKTLYAALVCENHPEITQRVRRTQTELQNVIGWLQNTLNYFNHPSHLP